MQIASHKLKPCYSTQTYPVEQGLFTKKAVSEWIPKKIPEHRSLTELTNSKPEA